MKKKYENLIAYLLFKALQTEHELLQLTASQDIGVMGIELMSRKQSSYHFTVCCSALPRAENIHGTSVVAFLDAPFLQL